MKTVDVKTSELSGAALDWAVAKSGGLKTMLWPQVVTVLYPDAPRFVPFKPSTDWAQGGQIIEREGIGFFQKKDEMYSQAAYPGAQFVKRGPTPLIAAMRCYVAAKFGDTVSIPVDLVA